MKYQNEYFNKKYGKEGESDKLAKLLGSPQFSQDLRYHIPLLEVEVIKMGNAVQIWRDKIEEEMKKTFFSILEDKKSHIENVHSNLYHSEILGVSDEDYYINSVRKCITESTPKEIKDIYLELSSNRTIHKKALEKLLDELNKIIMELDRDIENERIEEEKISEQKRKEIQERNNKWRKIEEDYSSIEEGFIYIMSHSLMLGIVKIGFTIRNPDERAVELTNSVNIPGEFKVEYFKKVKNPYILEQRVFNILNDYKTGGEYFRVLEEQARTIINEQYEELKNITE